MNVPSRPISAMDGYGVLSSLTQTASPVRPVIFKLCGHKSENKHRAFKKVSPGVTVRLSTGALIPKGVDAVVRLEETSLEKGDVVVLRPVPRWKDVERIGEDFRCGTKLIGAGDRVTPARLSLLMAAGIGSIRVHRLSRVGILSVGGELRTVGQKKSQGTVNNFAHLVAGYVSQLGDQSVLLGTCSEDPALLGELLKGTMPGLDMMITIGRSSVGIEDHAPDSVLGLPGAQMVFHGLKMLPVRPVGLASFQDKPVCMLPAHSVSCALSFFLVAMPVLNRLEGLGLEDRPKRVVAESEQEFENKRAIERLFLVQLRKRDTRRFASVLRWGSNLSYELASASGYVRVPAGGSVSKGAQLDVSIFPGTEEP